MRCAIACALLLATLSPSLAADWPMFRGPEVNGISRESGWSTAWPKDGPPVKWRAKVGLGFSTVVISGGKLIATGHDGRAKGKDTVWCLDAATGQELWKHTYAAPLGNKYFEGGTTGTPTIDGGRVYHLAREGDFFCFELATGKILYQRQLAKELGVEVPEWGFASSPLVQGDLLILNVGSHGTALDKATGKTVWQNGKGSAAYATAVPFDLDGARCVALLGHRDVAVVEVAGGKVRWQTIETTDDFGVVDIAKQIENFKGSAMYAVADWSSPSAQTLQVRLGTPNAWKLWVNGVLVFEREEYHRSTQLDQYSVPVQLKPGVNVLAFKICQNEQTQDWAQKYQFQLRVCDSTGVGVLPGPVVVRNGVSRKTALNKGGAE